MALFICLSVHMSCLGDRQRGICLYFSEGGLMRWCCPSVCLSVHPVSVIDSEVFVFISKGGLMRWCCPSLCLSVCPVSVIGSEVWFVFQRRRLNALALSICLSVRPSCLDDRQRCICLNLSEGDIMRWRCPSVCLSVRPVSLTGSEVFVCISAKVA